MRVWLANLSCTAIAYCALAAPHQLDAGLVVVDDGTFLAADWNHDTIVANPGRTASVTVTQQTTGGNPDSYQHGFVDYVNSVNGVVVETLHVHVGSAYDPSSQGAIESIDFETDLRAINPSGPSNSQATIALLLIQDGNYYLGSHLTVTKADGWTHVSDLARSSFSLLNSNASLSVPTSGPDFSNSGGVIQFGYGTRYSSNFNGNTATYGVDNLRITVNSLTEVPEPSSMALLGIGGLFTAGFRLRRRVRQSSRNANGSAVATT